MNNTSNTEKKHSAHHIVPMEIYTKVFLALVVLTVVTVASSYIDFGGSMNILIAMVIASTKALLVVLIFMGLKYDGQENNVTFFCSFVFLSIFVGLSSADLFYRAEPTPVRVDASGVPAGDGSPVDVSKLVHSSPDAIAKGKVVYTQNCATCHGNDGKGDGPAAAALTPKPRNFSVAEGWKNGRGVADIFKTLTEGLPGTPMPAFAGLSAEDRFALAHYIRSVSPNPPADKPEALAALEKQLGTPPKPRLSIDKAMEIMVREWEASRGNGS